MTKDTNDTKTLYCYDGAGDKLEMILPADIADNLKNQLQSRGIKFVDSFEK
jgi:hypothetical protein|nr:MAG TPA: hypothetical protein [Caudoviricetes sp.]